MKVKLLLVFGLFLTPSVMSAIGSHFWFGKTITALRAETVWGKETFANEKFKNGTVAERAKMAASLLRQKKAWKGRPLTDVTTLLGQHDGFYFTDSIPAYLIQIPEKSGEEAWQVVFLPNSDRMVEDIIIHKNCCN